jgi:predicted  nucleic acid-binding Zn-ribbon protein
MDKDFSELIEYLDKKFSKIEEDIQNLQIKVLNNTDEIKRNREEMATKVEVNKLVDAVDAYMKQGEDYRQEVVMLGNQVNRHEKWIQKIAEKLDLKLEH